MVLIRSHPGHSVGEMIVQVLPPSSVILRESQPDALAHHFGDVPPGPFRD